MNAWQRRAMGTVVTLWGAWYMAHTGDALRIDTPKMIRDYIAKEVL